MGDLLHAEVTTFHAADSGVSVIQLFGNSCVVKQAWWREDGRRRGGGWTYQLVGSPCVADRPARSYPLAGPPDCTLLLGSLKDQEENLIVVKTWT